MGVTIDVLVENRLAGKNDLVKILGRGELKAKLKITVHKFTASAQKAIEAIKNIWKIEELKNRILLTLGLLLVYRFGAQIVLPGIDASQLANLAAQTDGGLLGLLNAFTGGAFSNASVFALGIMPYISASIVVQLMGIAVPYLQKLQKEGESGRRKINQITRWLTIAITLIQGPGYITNLFNLLPPEAFVMGSNVTFIISSVIILTTGCILQCGW